MITVDPSLAVVLWGLNVWSQLCADGADLLQHHIVNVSVIQICILLKQEVHVGNCYKYESLQGKAIEICHVQHSDTFAHSCGK